MLRLYLHKQAIGPLLAINHTFKFVFTFSSSAVCVKCLSSIFLFIARISERQLWSSVTQVPVVPLRLSLCNQNDNIFLSVSRVCTSTSHYMQHRNEIFTEKQPELPGTIHNDQFLNLNSSIYLT